MGDLSLHGLRVLLVDDERDLRTLIRRRLERTAAVTVVGEAADGDQAIALATEHQPDVVLLDLLLGAEHGADLVAPLLRAAPKAMVAVLTMLAAEDEEQQVKVAGAFAFYEKTMLVDLAAHLRDDVASFRRALEGEDVVTPSAIARRR